MKRWMSLILIAVALAGCAAGGGGGGISIEGAWARPSPMEQGNGAVYMVIRNNGAEDDTLVAARADIAAVVEVHETVEMEGGMMGMRPVEGGIPIPAGGSAELKPGGYHIMLINMTGQLEPGTTIPVTLVFEKAGEIPIEAEVRAE